MPAGVKGKIVSIEGKMLSQRLSSMGLFPGREISKVSNLAFRGPVTIEMDRRHYVLGYGMASKVLVETDENRFSR
jgi:ferrous iron transport protein A